MSPHRTPRAPRSVQACPWCGPGTALALSYDKMGSVHLSCTQCNGAGPKVALDTDFASCDEAAILAWSSRSSARQIGRETLARIKLSIGLHCLNGSLTPDSAIGVTWSDLNALLQAVTVSECPSGD